MGAHMLRGWIGGILTLLALVLVAAPAQAHAELESSDPQDGATLAVAPTDLTFTFGEDILPEGNAVTLTDVASDARLEVGPVEVEGDTVSVSWPQSSPAGEFRAAYRVVSADGHPIDGNISFRVEQAVGADEPSPGSTIPPTSPPAASAGPAPVSASAAAPASPAPAADDADAGLLVWVLGVGIAVLIGAGAGAWVMRRTR